MTNTSTRRSAPSVAATEWGVIRTLWRRDMLRLRREPTRWFGVVFQPLLFWFIIGSGMVGTFTLTGIEQNYLQFFFPGILVMIILFTTIFGTISVIEDRQMGFLQGVLAAPGSRASMVLGKVAGVTSLALIQSTLFMAVGPFVDYSLADVHWLGLIAGIILSCVGLTALCFAMAWLLRSAQAYHAIMSVVLIPLWILSGAMFPPQGNWVAYVMVGNPMTYSVGAVRGALSGGTTAVGPSMGISLLVLAGFAVVGVMLAVLACRGGGGRAP